MAIPVKFLGWKKVGNNKYRQYLDNKGEKYIIVKNRKVYKPSSYLKKSRYKY